jgi:hypothetical protein
MSKLYIENRYGQTPNDLLNNEEISLKAKGLFAFLQSKPENWSFSIPRIAKQLKEGKFSIRDAIQELEKFGYLVRKPTKNKDGQWSGYDYILEDKPVQFTVIPETGTTVFPTTGNCDTLSKKDNSNKDIVIKKISCENKSRTNDLLNLFYKEVNPAIKFNNNTMRGDADWLVANYPFKKLETMVLYIKEHKGEQYFPTISNPSQLRDKMTQLESHIDKKKENVLTGDKLDKYPLFSPTR